MASSGDCVLDINNLIEVDHTCQQLSVNWEKIGGVLGISKTIIDIIAHSASAASMSKMLSSWLNRESPDQPLPTWKILCDAIAAVDRTAAEKIAADKGFTITHTDTQLEEKKPQTIPRETIRLKSEFNPPRVPDHSDPTTYDDKTVIIDHTRLKDLICDKEHITPTIVSPIIFVIDGLPNCGKSEALTKLLHKVIPESRSDAMTKESEMDERAGISYHELVAVGLPPAPFDRLTYSKVTKDTCYLYAIQSALKHLHYSYGQKIKFHNPSVGEREVVFDDEDLNDHFHQIFNSLAKDQRQESSSPLSATKWNSSIPSGIALINVWDIGMNKAVYHFLPALWGHLDNSYLWLFLDLDRDLKDLYNTPSLPENRLDKTRKDKDLIMPYRSTMEYLLRPAMLAKPSSGSDRPDVCSVFGVHSSTYEQTRLDDLVEHIRNASAQANLATVINTEEVIPINPKDGKCWKVLKRKADETIGAQLDSTLKVPLACIFLRSLYYGLDKIYIKKSKLKAKADLLNITKAEFEKFCNVFTSFGSIIDITRIDEKSDYVILRPTDFIRCLDKVFYPNTIDSRVAMCGIVTKSTAMEIFNADHEFFMDVLVSVDLAIRLRNDQIIPKSSEFPEEYFYMPDVRTNSPDLECQPFALHLLYSTNSPVRHLLVLFARSLLQIKPDSKLVCRKGSPVNITTFRVFTSHTRVAVDFEMRYLGEAVEFRIPTTADQDISVSIIQSCHEMMKTKWGCEKYNFAVMCVNDPNPTTPCRLRRMYHLLPDDNLCDTCMEQYAPYNKSMLNIWNAILNKPQYGVNEERKWKGGMLARSQVPYQDLLLKKTISLQAEKIESLRRANRKLLEELDGKNERNVQDTQAQTQELRNTQELLKIESLANMQELEDMKGKLKLSQDEKYVKKMEDYQKVQEIEPEQEKKPKPETSSTDKIQILQEEVETFQNTAVKQLAKQESILEKNQKRIKELEVAVQKLMQVFAVSPRDIIPEPECLQDHKNTNSANTEELSTLKQHVRDLMNTLTPYFPTGGLQTVLEESSLKDLDSHLEVKLKDILIKSEQTQQELEHTKVELNMKTHQSLVQTQELEIMKVQNTKMNEELNSLNVQVEEFKKIEESKVSSSHNSEVTKCMRDAAVQFSYMTPLSDHLDGVHVAGEIVFLIQADKPQSLNWEEYGFRLHISRDTISPSDSCEVAVKALAGGKFLFPVGTELVSAVYAISFSKKLLQPVKLEVQHCVALESEQQLKHLSFVTASLKQGVPLYQFQKTDGGMFSTESFYGSITRPQFCLICIVLDILTLCIPVSISKSSENTLVKVKVSYRKRANEDSMEIAENKKGKISHNEDIDDVHEPNAENEDVNVVADSCKRKRLADISEGLPSAKRKKKSDHKAFIINDNQQQQPFDCDERSTDKQPTSPNGLKKDKSGSMIPTFSLVYTGQKCYVKEGKDKWTMKFFVFKNINAFVKYVETRNFSIDFDDSIKFQFEDRIDGFIDLDLTEPQNRSYKGWTIAPRTEPLRIAKKDADLFGSDDFPIPSSCLVTVFAKQAQDTEELLNYTVPLSGIDSTVKKICIERSLESTEIVNRDNASVEDPDGRNVAPNITGNRAFHALLNKPPDSKDVFHLVRGMAADWFLLGGQLNIEMSFRESLRRENLHDETKLEKVLIEWIGNETSHVTWEVIITALKACRRKDIAKKIMKYLEEHDTYDKYIKLDDFAPFKL